MIPQVFGCITLSFAFGKLTFEIQDVYLSTNGTLFPIFHKVFKILYAFSVSLFSFKILNYIKKL